MIDNMSVVSERAPGSIEATSPAAIHETHTGVVVLVGDRAYKVKKHVKTDFLDFSTVEAREQVCHREVSLNRRLAASSYLGIAHLVGLPDAPDEPVIVMRRHPESRCLAALVANGSPVETELAEIAVLLADFHQTAERGHLIEMCATVDAVAEHWRANLTELREYTRDILAAQDVVELWRLSAEFIAGRRALFGQRIEANRIVDGHGDLLAADIYCLAEGPALLDCLEFDDQLRYVDGIDDAAFLAMDLEFLGRRDLGALFLEHYCRRAEDHPPPALVHFYIAYRAVVRAKVDCIRAHQGSADAATAARRHLAIALEHLRVGMLRLIIIGGGPGTGKSTLSQSLAGEIGARVISTDEVRRELRESGRIGGSTGTLGSGLYTRENVDAVYGEVCRRAKSLLAGGNTVILDGTWRNPGHRATARAMASDLSVPILEFVCTTSLDEARARISQRVESPSDATEHMAAPLTPELDEWVGAHRVDTSRSLRESLAEAREICCTGI